MSEAAVKDPPKTDPKPEIDPTFNYMLKDLGQLVEEDKKVELPPEMPGRMTTGEAARLASEKASREEPENPEEKKEPEQKPEEAEKPKEEKPVEKPAPKVVPKPRASDDMTAVQELIDKRIAESAKASQPPPEQKPPAEKPAEDQYEKSLGEVELDELRFARYASGKDPSLEKYPQQLLEYFKKVDAYVEKTRKEDPDRNFDDTDEEWKKFQRENRPQMSPLVRRRLEREQIVEEAKASAKEEYRAELAKVQKRQEILEKRPAIERAATEFSKALNTVLETDSEGEEPTVSAIAKRAQESSWKAVIAEDPVFAPIVQKISQTANELASEYLALVNGTRELDLKNQHHAWLSRFVTEEGESFAAKGGDATIRQGRQFLPRHKFIDFVNQDPGRADKFWTWNDQEVLERIAANARKNAVTILKAEQEKLAKAGFERKKPEPPKKDLPKSEKKTVAEPEKNGAPKATSSVSPGISQPGKVNGPPGGMTLEEVQILIPGYKPA